MTVIRTRAIDFGQLTHSSESGYGPVMTARLERPSRVPEWEVRLRGRNQITVPEEVVRVLGVSEGDRLILRVGQDGQSVVVRPIRRSYAGALRGLWPEGSAEFLRRERAAWERRPGTDELDDPRDA